MEHIKLNTKLIKSTDFFVFEELLCWNQLHSTLNLYIYLHWLPENAFNLSICSFLCSNFIQLISFDNCNRHDVITLSFNWKKKTTLNWKNARGNWRWCVENRRIERNGNKNTGHFTSLQFKSQITTITLAQNQKKQIFTTVAILKISTFTHQGKYQILRHRISYSEIIEPEKRIFNKIYINKLTFTSY